ncbi:MAG: hypothetical protein H0V17_10045 [Deltaproteobacteria bacterium]|nr:hypothetical protein [Deltaproteobacteria bacterium]
MRWLLLVLSACSPQPPDVTCVLATEPAGADIFAMRRDRMFDELDRRTTWEHDPNAKPILLEIKIGTTPISKVRSQWILESIGQPVFEARLAGYKPLRVATPLVNRGCSTEVYRLETLAP